MRVWAAAALLACLAARPSYAAEVAETYRTSFGAFLQGRYDEAEAGMRYLATLGVDQGAPSANLAILARDRGAPDEALPMWMKATMLDPTDAFLWNQRGWTYLSLGRYKEARDSFKKGIEVSSTPFHAAEGQLGLGMAEAMDSDSKAAVLAYQGAFTRSPYLLPAAAAQLGRLAFKLGKDETAETYLRQSLSQDAQQPDVALELARVYEKSGAPKAAWQGYKLVLDLEPGQAEASEGLKRVAGFIIEKPESLLPVRRLARPMMSRPSVPPEGPKVRVGLFADSTGKSSQAAHLFFMTGSAFKVVDVALGEVSRGREFEQWEAAYKPESRVIELRDAQRNLQYTTKQAFRIEPVDRGATVLLKSVEVPASAGVDIGDREVRGAVEFVPTPDGFQLVNEVGLEDYLFGVVAAAMPGASPPEALKAQAIVSRTRAARVPPRAHDAFLKTDLCDSAHCLLYSGLTQESSAATQAVLATNGGKLYKDGAPAPADQHLSCGGATAEGVEDRPRPGGQPRSPLEFERMTHGYPGPDLYCEASSLIPTAWSRWARVLDAGLLRARLEKSDNFVGKIEGVRVMRRQPTGRVEALEVKGSRKSVVLEGPAIAAFLSPGGLRSTLITLQPVYQGRALKSLIVWGAGTGDGRGMCIAGAMGQAHLGRDHKAILEHYFPGTKLEGARPVREPSEPAPVPQGAAPAEPGTPAAEGEGPQTGGGPTLSERLRAKKAKAFRRRQAQKALEKPAAAPADESPKQ